MVAKEDLERQIKKLKDRLQKGAENSETSLAPDKIRLFRKRLKRTQRKLAKKEGKAETAVASTASSEEGPEEKAPDEEGKSNTAVASSASEEDTPQQKALDEESSEDSVQS